MRSEHKASIWQADAFYDADGRGCASTVLDAIRDNMLRLVPNQTLEVRASDAIVQAELAAWCQLSGHALIMQAGDHHLIRHR